MKIVTVLGTRPELIKLSEVIKKLDMFHEHVFVHTGQNYDFELNEIFYKDLDLRKPDVYLDVSEESPMATIAKILEKTDQLFRKVRPDALVLYGDTNSCLCILSAKRLKIPVFHMEAGNRCFDQRVPEELNRKVVDHLSDINFVHSDHARKYLEREGIRPETIIRSGSPMKEIYSRIASKVESCKALEEMGLKREQFFVVSSHREENIDSEEQFKAFLDSLSRLRETYPDFPIVVSTHPRTRKKMETLDLQLDEGIQFMKPMGFVKYLRLQMEAFCVISDSGTLTEEASLLGFPGVMIRQSHERPEGMDYGVLVQSDLKPENLLDGVQMATKGLGGSAKESIPDYHNEFYSDQILKCIQSYVPYVNRTVWHRN